MQSAVCISRFFSFTASSSNHQSPMLINNRIGTVETIKYVEYGK